MTNIMMVRLQHIPSGTGTLVFFATTSFLYPRATGYRLQATAQAKGYKAHFTVMYCTLDKILVLYLIHLARHAITTESLIMHKCTIEQGNINQNKYILARERITRNGLDKRPKNFRFAMNPQAQH